MRFVSIASGSSGNCIYTGTEESHILIDAGISAKRIEQGLNEVGLKTSELDGICITHEHSDHVKSLGTLSNKYNIPVYANLNTWNAMPEQKNKVLADNQNVFVTNQDFEIKDLKIHPFAISHDAAEPCGFNIYNKKKKISVATDLGHVSPELLANLEKSAFVLLEANYDPEILKYSRYPYSLKQRIAGPNGHLSNNNSGEIVSHLMKSGLTNVMLGHLSKENNFPELAYKTVVEEIISNKRDESSIHVGVARRDGPSGVIDIA